MALLRRRVISRIKEESKPKVVIIGLDFGTSYTKVYFNQDGEYKKPIKFQVDGKSTYFKPTELYYDSESNKIYYNPGKRRDKLKYFKYSMINDNLSTSTLLKQNNKAIRTKPELLCSIFYLACLIKEIKSKIEFILESKNIQYSINMGCPIENFADKNKGIYDKVLKVAYELSDTLNTDETTLNEINQFYKEHKTGKLQNLQTIPELYAEALWFIEQPSTGEGIYSIIDIGGGTVDCASIHISRNIEGEKHTKIYSQNVLPLGVEILLQYMYPTNYDINREECIKHLRNDKVKMPYGITQKDLEDRKIYKASEFDKNFATSILEVKERNDKLMDEQNIKRKFIPYYSFGGGADFNWYHSIIDSHNSNFSRVNIPPLRKQEVILDQIEHNRLIIAEQLTRSNFPDIDGFPWHFSRKKLFGSLNRDEELEDYNSDETNYSDRLADLQRDLYGDD